MDEAKRIEKAQNILRASPLDIEEEESDSDKEDRAFIELLNLIMDGMDDVESGIV